MDNGFSEWTLRGVKHDAGTLEFDSATVIEGYDPYAAGTYHGRNYYNGRSFLVGEAISPEIRTAFDFTEAIVSWNASTPAGSWIQVHFRAQYDTRWSKWYVLGIWASDESTISRHSVNAQDDEDGSVLTDTFISSNKKETTNKFQSTL